MTANGAHELVGLPWIHFFHACEMAHRVEVRAGRKLPGKYRIANYWPHLREKA